MRALLLGLASRDGNDGISKANEKGWREPLNGSITAFARQSIHPALSRRERMEAEAFLANTKRASKHNTAVRATIVAGRKNRELQRLCSEANRRPKNTAMDEHSRSGYIPSVVELLKMFIVYFLIGLFALFGFWLLVAWVVIQFALHH